MSEKKQAEKADPDVNAITAALAAPFHKDEVHWKPQTVSGNRALVVAFVDARVIQDRLDDVLGVMGWQDSYECLPDGSVVCRLKVKIGQEWIVKEDVGGQSEQPDEGDRRKAAFSDALKRAAVKFGIGRYLYRQKPQWMDYDPQKRRIVGTPTLAEGPQETPRAQPKPAAPKKGLPADGKELLARLSAKEADLARAGTCKAGELLGYVKAMGTQAGAPDKLQEWAGEAIQHAVDHVKAFEAGSRLPAGLKERPAGEKTLPDLVLFWDELGQEAGLPDGALGDAAVEHFRGRLGDDWAAWPEAARDEVVKFLKAKYAALVGPLPVLAEQAAEVTALIARKDGATWPKLRSAMGLKVSAIKDLTRAQFAQAVRLLSAMPDKKAGKKSGAA